MCREAVACCNLSAECRWPDAHDANTGRRCCSSPRRRLPWTPTTSAAHSAFAYSSKCDVRPLILTSHSLPAHPCVNDRQRVGVRYASGRVFSRSQPRFRYSAVNPQPPFQQQHQYAGYGYPPPPPAQAIAGTWPVIISTFRIAHVRSAHYCSESLGGFRLWAASGATIVSLRTIREKKGNEALFCWLHRQFS